MKIVVSILSSCRRIGSGNASGLELKHSERRRDNYLMFPHYFILPSFRLMSAWTVKIAFRLTFRMPMARSNTRGHFQRVPSTLPPVGTALISCSIGVVVKLNGDRRNLQRSSENCSNHGTCYPCSSHRIPVCSLQFQAKSLCGLARLLDRAVRGLRIGMEPVA